MTDKKTPQQRANERQNKARQDLPRIPMLFISESEAAILDDLARLYGTKKAAIIAGLKKLHSGLSNPDKALIASTKFNEHRSDTPNAYLMPTVGGYQKPVIVTELRETAAFYFVKAEGKFGELKFAKKTMMRVGPGKDDFPKYKLVIEPSDKQQSERFNRALHKVTSAVIQQVRENIGGDYDTASYEREAKPIIEIIIDHRLSEADMAKQILEQVKRLHPINAPAAYYESLAGPLVTLAKQFRADQE